MVAAEGQPEELPAPTNENLLDVQHYLMKCELDTLQKMHPGGEFPLFRLESGLKLNIIYLNLFPFPWSHWKHCLNIIHVSFSQFKR